MRAASCPASRGLEPGGAAGLGEFAHPEDVALALGHRDHSARVEKVEDVAPEAAPTKSGLKRRRRSTDQRRVPWRGAVAVGAAVALRAAAIAGRGRRIRRSTYRRVTPAGA